MKATSKSELGCSKDSNLNWFSELKIKYVLQFNSRPTSSIEKENLLLHFYTSKLISHSEF